MMHARLCELGDAIDTHFALSRRMELEEEITFFGGQTLVVVVTMMMMIMTSMVNVAITTINAVWLMLLSLLL